MKLKGKHILKTILEDSVKNLKNELRKLLICVQYIKQIYFNVFII